MKLSLYERPRIIYMFEAGLKFNRSIHKSEKLASVLKILVNLQSMSRKRKMM